MLTCVGNDSDVRPVVLGEEGVFSGADAGAILIDHTTASAQLARELAAAAGERGLLFLDAPVSGGHARLGLAGIDPATEAFFLAGTG